MKAVGCLGLGSSLMLLDEELGGTEKFYTVPRSVFSQLVSQAGLRFTQLGPTPQCVWMVMWVRVWPS